MMIYVCDKCGKRKEVSQIVGNEFKYCNEFYTLAKEVLGKRDFCSKCFKSVQQAELEAKKGESSRLWDFVRKAVING